MNGVEPGVTDEEQEEDAEASQRKDLVEGDFSRLSRWSEDRYADEDDEKEDKCGEVKREEGEEDEKGEDVDGPGGSGGDEFKSAK